jgi:hypothetical protein
MHKSHDPTNPRAYNASRLHGTEDNFHLPCLYTESYHDYPNSMWQ